MASRNFHRPSLTTEPGVVTVFCRFTGAADVQANGYTLNDGSAFVTSITRQAEGEFRVLLSNNYSALLGAYCIANVADTIFHIESEDVDSATTPYVDIIAVTAGSATDPDSDTVYVTLFLKNSSVPN